MSFDEEDHITIDPIRAAQQYIPKPVLDPALNTINNAHAVTIHADTPQDLHPGLLDNLGPALAAIGPTGLQIYGNAKQALRSHYESISLQQQAVAAAMKPNPNPITRHQVPFVIDEGSKESLAAALTASFEKDGARDGKLVPAIEAGMKEIQQRLDAELLSTPKGPADQHAIAGIWAFVARQKNPFEFVAIRIKSGDKRLVTAVLSDSPFLSGLNDAQAAALRSAAELAWCGPLVAARTAATAVHAMLMRARATTIRQHLAMTPKVRENLANKALARLQAGGRQ